MKVVNVICFQNTFAYFDEKGRLVRINVKDHDRGDGLDASIPADASSSSFSKSHEDDSEFPSKKTASKHPRDACNGSTTDSPTPHHPSSSPRTLPLSPRSNLSRSSSSASHSSSSSSSTSCLRSGGSKTGEQQPVYRGDAPLPRLHGHLIVRGNSLMLYGGLIELDDKEVTLDDCWTLNLSKR